MVNATACHAVDWEFDPPSSRHFTEGKGYCHRTYAVGSRSLIRTHDQTPSHIFLR